MGLPAGLSKLTPTVYDKVWGSSVTEPWFENPGGRRIGEIWFSAPEVLPLLVKFLFTSDRMSVQVHPGDAYAQMQGERCGKTEMWHVLRADSGAQVGVGLRETASGERVREAAINGEITELMTWLPAHAGETFFIPAGVIHALGAGLVLCEVQQFSDLTYRMFDYHRQPARPLHLDDALAVAELKPYEGRFRRQQVGDGRELLAECDYFRVERLEFRGRKAIETADRPRILAVTDGEGRIAGEPFRMGEAWLLAAGAVPVSLETTNAGTDATFLLASG